MRPDLNSKDPLERQYAVDKAAEAQREQRAKAAQQREKEQEDQKAAGLPFGGGPSPPVGRGSSGWLGFAVVAIIALVAISSKSGQPVHRDADPARAAPPSLPPTEAAPESDQRVAEPSSTPVPEPSSPAEALADAPPSVVAAEPAGEMNTTQAGDAGAAEAPHPSTVRVPASRASPEKPPQAGPTHDYAGG